jgi:hypothetical protein
MSIRKKVFSAELLDLFIHSSIFFDIIHRVKFFSLAKHLVTLVMLSRLL